LFKRLAN